MRSAADDLIAENTDFQLAPLDCWSVMDRWWTDSPERRSYLTIRAPSGKTAAVCWDLKTEEWTIVPEPHED